MNKEEVIDEIQDDLYTVLLTYANLSEEDYTKAAKRYHDLMDYLRENLK